ncbi:MAG: hypothetical protein ACTSVI_04170 [Promethearchaeota archaeon]
MDYRRLIEKASKKTLYLMLAASIGISLLFEALMSYYLTISGNEIDLFTSELSFSASVLQEQYAILISKGGLQYYKIVMFLDYGFMLGYGLLIFSLGAILARKMQEGKSLRKIGELIPFLGLIAVTCDVFENYFILRTLENPLLVLEVDAIAQSIFALIKWSIVFFALGWAIVVGIFLAFITIKTRGNKNAQE